ncbi:MAG: DUF6240 domain-containing protein [Lachnospiraceae bacterium]|nr:DUF6240 domain-containing protein [Lachnospiraceae bacterium]
MNIEMINNHGAVHSNDVEHMTYGNPVSTGSRMSTEKLGFSLDITGKVKENAAYGKEELKSAEDIAQMAGMTNVSLQRDYMAVMSNSMSDEDFAQLMKDGVNPTQIPAGETVTNLDRIKIRMAEAGTTIAGYNDDISEEDVKAVLGNTINAGKIISDTLISSDLPASSDNVSGIRETVRMAQNLKPLTDEAKTFMIAEDLAPTVENIYRAEYSAGAASAVTGGVHFDGAATYAGSEYTKASWDELKDQAVEVIKEAGIEDVESALTDAKWIAEHSLPLTKETLEQYDTLKDINVPADPRDLIAAMTVAIEEGKTPKEADLLVTKSIYDRASELVETFRNMDDPKDLTKHRELEEVRLVMTKEANLTLLRKGINIETEPLEKLVEELKEAEREFYEPLLGRKDEEPEELDVKIDLFKQTQSIIRSIPDVPVRVIADRVVSKDITLEGIARDGVAAKAAYDRAGETYEALMTAPRADMGDSIRKAFRNVDEILQDLDMDLNDANRKAVRTLGYAGMMINKESIDSVRTATHSVERVISLMTPARTLSMIRDGVNPIGENIFDLEKTLSEEPFEETGDRYARFLLKLERSGNITEDEKQTFIGMYRLFNLIEKQDGKVIGNVLSSGKELTLKNMLEASRSNRHMNSEYVIDDDFGLLEQVVEKGESITSQLERTFMQMMDPVPDKSYIDEKIKDIRTASKIKDPEEILSVLEQPVTVENILAVSAMSEGMGKGFKKMFSRQEQDDDREDNGREVLTEEDARKLADELSDRDSASAAYERFLDKAARIAKESALSSETYEDVRTYSMLYKQVGFAASLSGRESYEIPVYLEDGWTSIHLTIEHSKDDAGKVRASFGSEEYGKVEASFSLKQSGVDGFIVSDSRSGVDNLKNIDDKIREEFRKEDLETSNLSYVFSKYINTDVYIPGTDSIKTDNSRLYRIAKAFIGAVQRS